MDARLVAMLNSPKKKNWIVVHLGLDYMRIGLANFVSEEVAEMHRLLSQKLSYIRNERCSNCTSNNIRWHAGKNTWVLNPPCPFKICDMWLKEILTIHKNLSLKNIHWQNCDITSWPDSKWEVAKVFAPKSKSFSENCTGANDLLSILDNCKHFHKQISKQGLLLVEKIFRERNNVLQTGLMQLSNETRETLLNDMIKILKDPDNLGLRQDCILAVENIQQIQTLFKPGQSLGGASETPNEEKSERFEIRDINETTKTDSLLYKRKKEDSTILMEDPDSNLRDSGLQTQDQDAKPKKQQPQTKKLGNGETDSKEGLGLSEWRKDIKEILADKMFKENLEMFLSEKKTSMVLEMVLQYILETKNKEALTILMTYISAEWRKDLSDNTISVWFGLDYRYKNKVEETLVCFHSTDIVSSFSRFIGLPVIYRRFDEIEMEPLENRLDEKFQGVSFNKKDAGNIKRLISEQGEDLFKCYSNLEAIAASSVKSTRNGIVNKASILLYCRLKGVIPYGEVLFPKELKVGEQCYVTDVREGFFSLGMIPAQRHVSTHNPLSFNPALRMGCSIGAWGSSFSGTLGPFVKTDDGDTCFLTCAHVLGIGHTNTHVLQPANSKPKENDTKRICGTFKEEKFDTRSDIGVDAALVLVDQTKRKADHSDFVWMGTDQLLSAGFTEDDSPSFKDGEVILHAEFEQVDGKRIIKFGKASGLTRGAFVLDGIMVKRKDAKLSLPDGMPPPPGYSETTFLMKGQFLVKSFGQTPFFTLGDSGSGVYAVERKRGKNIFTLIGLAIGCLPSYDCVVTPIGSVLNAFGLSERHVLK